MRKLFVLLTMAIFLMVVWTSTTYANKEYTIFDTLNLSESEESEEFNRCKIVRDEPETFYQRLMSTYNRGWYKEAKKSAERILNCIEYKDTREIYNSIQNRLSKEEIAERERKAAHIKELDESVRALPASQLEKNLELYVELLGLDPDNPRYKRKVDHYRAKILAAERAKLIDTDNFRIALDIRTLSWTVNDWNTAKWTVRIRNNSIRDWKDIVIKVSYYGPSGTRIYRSIFGHTEYIIIPSGKSAVIAFDDIMCPEQAARAGAEIAKATIHH